MQKTLANRLICNPEKTVKEGYVPDDKAAGRGDYGTGSYPLPPQGWQRASRRSVSHDPLRGPYLRRASTAYCEQVGTKRQEGGVKGEMQYW